MSFHGKTEALANLIFKLFDLFALKLDDFFAVLANNVIMMRVLGIVRIVEFVILAEIHFTDQTAFCEQWQSPVDSGPGN